MNVSRKDFILGAAAAGATAVSGCKHLPTVDAVKLAAKAIGGATGLVLNECDIPSEARAAIIEITEKVLPCIPEIGVPLETAWTPIAQAHVDKLIADGKIDAALGPVIMAAFKLVVRGFALLEQKYPAVRTSRELLEAAVSGFGEGLLDTLKPTVDAFKAATVDVTAVGAIRRSNEFHRLRGACGAYSCGRHRPPLTKAAK